jgi:hypothetical protein
MFIALHAWRNVNIWNSFRHLAMGGLLILLLTPQTRGGALISEDFEAGDVSSVSAYAVGGAKARQQITSDGTIDSYMGQPGRCITLNAQVPGPGGTARAGVTIGCSVDEGASRDLNRLTIAADLWIDHVQPVTVKIASIDSNGNTTGTLAGVTYPPIAGAWHRQELDLSWLQKQDGTFDPACRRVKVSFELSAGADASETVLRVDNLSLSSPSFYVSSNGHDSADGRSESTAFATVQRGIDAAAPGDVVMIMDGEYHNTNIGGLATVKKAGSPAKWITIRSCPGQNPKLINNGWEVFKFPAGAAYIELRGLDISGNRKNVKLADALADELIREKGGSAYSGDPLFNGNGISVEGRQAPSPELRPHHLRFIGNHVHDNCGGGISGQSSDYLCIEGNNVHDNAHYMRYAGSGMSFLVPFNFDKSTSTHFFMLGNFVRNNRCYVPWAAIGKMSDGNGIIVDVNINKAKPAESYWGRTLVANNICVSNGGGGITVTTARHILIVNNTLYHNVQTTDLAKRGWGELMLGGPPPNSEDVRLYNNIVWADAGRPIITANRINDWTSKNNILFGDPGAKFKTGDAGDANNLVADPKLKNPSLSGSPEDFSLLADSPAAGHGSPDFPGVQLTDLAGQARSQTNPISCGALEFQAK